MPNLNRVMLMGNLTRDPELRYTTNNNSVCQLGLAINHRWKDANGEQKEEVTFIDCEAWGRTGEVLNQYLKKGKPVYLEGRLKLDQWQDKEGNNRSKLKVVVEGFQFIDPKGGGDGGGQGGSDGGERTVDRGDQRGAGGNQGSYNRPPAQGSRPPQQQRSNNNAPAPAPAQAMEPHQPVDEENIPF